MAAPIIIRAELNNSDLRRAADETEKAFKSAIDRINQHAQRLRDTFSGLGDGLSGVGRGGGRGGSGGGGAANAANESLRLAQAQARLQATSRDTAGAINVLNNAIDQSTAKERVLIGAKTQLAALFNRQEAETKKVERARIAEAAATQRSANADLAKAQALARLKQVQGDTVGAARVLQTALDGSTASMNRQLAAQTQLQRVQNINQAGWRRYASTIREAGESIQQAGYGLLAITGGIVAVGRSAVQSAINIDKQVNSLRALTGSAEAAEARFKALFELSQRTPGLTTNLALTLDAQLRAANVSEANINKVLPAVGRINAVSPLGDPQKFAQNLLQLITQNFERTDLKELVGQSPIAGRLISEIFNVENPTNAKAIRESAKKLGLTSADAFFSAFGDAAARSSALGSVTESIGTQIEKLQDRIAVALRPLGLEILKVITPALERLVPVIEDLLRRFSELSPGAKTAVLAIGGIAAAVGPAVIALGGLIQTVGAFGNLVTVITALGGAGATATGAVGGGGIAAITGALGAALPVIGGVAIAVGALAAAWYTDFGGIRQATTDAWNEITQEFERLGPIRSQIATDLSGITGEFRAWSDASKPIVKGFWDFFGDVATTSISLVSNSIAFLTNTFSTGLQQIRRLATGAPDLFGVLTNAIIPGSSLLTSTLGRRLGDTVPAGPPTTTFQDFGNAVKVDAFGRPLPNQSGVLSDASSSLFKPRTFTGGAGDSDSKKAEAAARQLRGANEEFARAQAKATAELEEKLIRNRIEFDREAFQERQISADQYYQRLTENELRIQDITKERLEADLAASRARAAGAKAGSPEQIKERAQALDIEKQLQILELERPNILRKIRQELENTAKTDVETASKAIANANKLITDQIGALREAQRTRPQAELNTREIQIQNQVAAGLISQTQATDQLILTRRAYRDAIIESEKAALAELDQNKATNASAIKQINDRIEQTKALGAELTSVERLQKAVELNRQQLLDQLQEVKIQGATIGENFDLKGQIAQQQAINATRQAEEDASLSIIASRERIANATILSSNRANAIFLDHLAQQKSVTESTADAMISAYEGVAGSIDKGINSLTRKLGIFGEAISGILKSITRSILSSIFAPGGGGGQGGGSVIGNLFGGLLGGNRGGAAGGLGGFLTPGFNPNASGGGGGIGNIIGSLGGILGNGVTAPESVSFGGLPAGRSFAVGLTPPPGATGSGGGFFGKLFGGLGLNSGLFKGFGFGLGKNAQVGSLAAAAPFLGAGLGASLGGSSALGQLLGGAGGALLGIGLTGASGVFAAGGSLGFLAPLFSNPITAIVGAALLPTAFLIGRARQRRKDERASGDFLQNAIDSIRDLRGSVARDEVDGTQARKIFRSEILETFKQQIGTLKTKSVRESRLTNQVRDLEKLYKDEVVPEIEKQATRRRVFGRLTPEFATGGVMPFDGFAFLHKGEIIANPRQQTPALVNAAAAAGVPGVQAISGGGATGAINLYVSIGLSKTDTQEIVLDGMDSETGQAVLLNLLNQATKNGDYRR